MADMINFTLPNMKAIDDLRSCVHKFELLKMHSKWQENMYTS